MNSFFIPALAGQIYAMPGMQTELHAAMNHAGDLRWLLRKLQRRGFFGMRFKFHGMSAGDFARWVQKAKADGKCSAAKTTCSFNNPANGSRCDATPLSRRACTTRFSTARDRQ